MSDQQSTATAPTSNPPTIFGADAEVAALVRRVRFMIPGAQNAPDDIVWKACQMARAHRLDPFTGDISIYSFKSKSTEGGIAWIADTGISAWRREAQRKAKYVLKDRQLAEEELRALRGTNYKVGDVGAEVKLWRLDVAEQCQKLNIPYEPMITHGFWCIVNIAGYADQIPNTETPYSVAARRAEKKALKKAFNLGFPDIEEAFELRTLQLMAIKADTSDMQHALLAEKALQTEPDGDILYAK